MTSPARYRIAFGKAEAMRFTGHLDLHRTWERTIRRAGLPLAYSEGFNPQPRLNIGAALPLGCLSRGDLIDVWLERDVDPGDVERALRRATPPGIAIEGVARMAAAEPVLQTLIESAVYEVASDEFPARPEMVRRIDELLASARLPRSRRGKSYDLRPLIETLAFDEGQSSLRMCLSAHEAAVGRPEEVLDALGLDPTHALAVRTELVLHDPGPKAAHSSDQGQTETASEPM